MSSEQNDFIYVTTFRQLELTEPIREFQLLPGVRITNDPATKRRLLTSELARFAGAIEYSHLETTPNLVFGEFGKSFVRASSAENALKSVLLWISWLFKNAWLVKDHAMRCEGAYLTFRTASGGPVWTNNSLASSPTFADGTSHRTVEMSVPDLTLWRETNHSVETYLHEKASSSLQFMMQKDYARSGRAMEFVNTARTARNIAIKIANYCSALETLFTTDSIELSHKLAERVAFFLDSRGENRATVFRSIKKLYGIRSKVVHGDVLQPRQIEELPLLSVQCDNYLRAILKAIFESDELKEVFDSRRETVEEYFTELILGPSKADING